jgi:hypothetical protein
MTIKCTFYARWHKENWNQVVDVDCDYFPETGEVVPVRTPQPMISEAKLGGEWITTTKTSDDITGFHSAQDIKVCPVCHRYVMKTEMNPGIGDSFEPEEICRDPDCPSNERVS